MSKFKKQIKKLISITLIATLILGALSLIGCSSSSNTGSGKDFFFTIRDNNDSFRATLQSSIESAAKAKGATVTTKYCGLKADQQVADIKEAAASGKYSAIICVPADSSTALQLELAAGDLPVIFINNKPDDSVLKPNKYVYVASDEYQAGTFQAEYMYELLGKPKEINAIILMGERNHSGTIGRTEAVKNFFKDNGVTLNIVFNDYANWSDEEADDYMKLFFKTGQKVDVIFSNNDTMALGAIKALKEAGYNTSQIPVAGVDATKEGCQSIANNELNFTVYQNGAKQGEKAIEVAIALADKKDTSKIEGINETKKCFFVDFEKVTKSNVSSYQ